ncbi:uncharacterized protein LOC122059160 [Macadamia integrifolia]|uniref:uncharacterized protein LOC122059160 n=1 Tax=Macadamia integrifolia TaxID=60698 RepID=UPI001C52CC0A|nr:uncharacterized protein LOC122059160 [Macadamia integrifolia]
MDRNWIHKSRDRVFRAGNLYKAGVIDFLDFAFSKVPTRGKITCSCVYCINQWSGTRDEVFEYLIVDGIMSGYTLWSFHGEVASSNTTTIESPVVDEEDDHIVNMHDILQDAFPGQELEGASVCDTSGHTDRIGDDSEKYHRLMQEAKKALYPRCKEFTKLSCTIALCNWSNKSFTMLLTLLKKALPQDNTVPNSFYGTKKLLKDLGLSYNKIDACPNDCMLYWNDASNEKSCGKCDESRYKSNNKTPLKTLRHFPLIPKLQRLYKSSVTSLDMRWHKEGRTNDGKIRHPADSKAWKDFDRRH